MSNKSQIYLMGLLIYIVAAFAGFVIEHYWLTAIASIIIAIFVYSKVSRDEELYRATRFDCISIYVFALFEIILTVLISLFELPLEGFLAYLNLGVQTLGCFFIGYALVRYALDTTNIKKVVTNRFVSRKGETIISSEPDNKVSETINEVIEEETKEEVIETMETEVVEPEIMSIELKKEETSDIQTPYMEEEI